MASMLVATGLAVLAAVLLVMRLLPPTVVTTEARDVAAPGELGLAATGVEGGGPVPEGVQIALIQLRTVDDLLGRLLVTSAVVLVVALALGTWLSWVVAGRLLRPVDQLAAAAREIDHGSLRPALDLGGRRDEIGRLAGTVREMVLRLDRSYQAQRRFAANASHELRTPLATTQAMLDVALADPDAVDVERFARQLREVNARSAGTVTALLALADAQAGDADVEPVDLADLVRAAVATVVPTGQESGTTLVTDLAPVVVDGDRALLGVLVDNLVGNAFRHGRPGGQVRVALRTDALVVENDGDLLDEAEVALFAEPFHRRAGRVQGSHGLGLALVAAVAERHGAELWLRPRDGGGLIVTVVFASGQGTARQAIERQSTERQGGARQGVERLGVA